MILGTFGSFLANLTLDQWVKLAPAAIEFVSAAVKLGEQVEPIIAKHQAQVEAAVSKQPRGGQHSAAELYTAHMQWTAAWTEVDQRIADQQGGSRG